jgi:hypothetical protein
MSPEPDGPALDAACGPAASASRAREQLKVPRPCLIPEVPSTGGVRFARDSRVAGSRDEGADGGRHRIYDLSMRFLGFLNAPYPTNIPPMVVPVAIPESQSTRYLLVTFNGTQYFENVLGDGTHGDFYVMEAVQVVKGYESPPR